ncbi:putative PEP-binding protein [Vibrio rumoiensis]|uniref:Phosphoenolpyruvate synthase n=1 Tax=Vibrio rumoiensis 1S-45 TaxID=1188252 RepID=A0A1E5E0W5_9VIBR|nr:putative PEP-binding protein [Vibrio rumoiensis]OEF24105.1 phosphoenolpyruvate synthase [Vibrio rumoiensis 1S-45]
MSQSHQGSIPTNALLGDVLPSPTSSQIENASHLFVSLSELIQDNIFYHPEIGQHLDTLSAEDKAHLDTLLNGHTVDEHFVSTLGKLIETAIKPQHKHIRICLSDADSYAYRALIGGNIEKNEINPAIGLRGVSRFASDEHTHSFELECKVIKALREKGIDIEIVVPFVRTLSDAAMIIDRLAVQRLPRGLNGLKVLYCCDAPAAVLMADRLLQYFDGLVVNTGNLTQLTLGVDQHNESLTSLFNPEHEAVLMLMTQAVKSASNANKPCIVYCQNLAQYPKVQDTLAELDPVQLLAAV